VLQSVLVHRGSVSGGHYYAFVRPVTSGMAASEPPVAHNMNGKHSASMDIEDTDGQAPGTQSRKKPSSASADEQPSETQRVVKQYLDAPWYKFDDDEVFVTEKHQAIEQNFGGMHETHSFKWGEKVTSD